MQYGVTLPDHVDAPALVALGQEAEEAGWDGVFLWDPVWGLDPWITLTGVALRTTRVRLGTMLTPVSRRRPWTLASQLATLDHLSGGRVILPVGLGAAGPEHTRSGFARVGEETNRTVRAQLLDEALEIVTGLWSGAPLHYQGRHYHLEDVTFSPRPVQSPRIPIWVVGAWPRPASMRRVVRYDGILPDKIAADGTHAPQNTDGTNINVTPDDIRAIKAFVDERRTLGTPFAIVIEGETRGDDPAGAVALLRPYAEAGVTWWLENVWDTPWDHGGVAGMRARIRQGPPRLA